MPILLPLLAVIQFFIFFLPKNGIRIAFIYSALTTGAFFTLGTLIMHSIRNINQITAIIIWCLINTAVFILNVYSFKNRKLEFGKLNMPFNNSQMSVLFALAVFATLTFFIALFYPPNTGDSLSYHLPRVIHWIQNNSLDFYPTSINRQLYTSAGLEYIILHLQLLSAGDYFANLVQWFCMAGGIAGVSLVIKELGGTLKAQLAGAVVAITLPMGILQSTSSKNDYLLSFFLICFLFATLKFARKSNTTDLIFSSIAFGLSIAAKSTVYIFAAPILIFLTIRLFRINPRRMTLWVISTAFLTILFNGFQLRSNQEYFGNAFGPNREDKAADTSNLKYSNDEFGPRLLISNLIKNISLHLGTPYSYFNYKLYELSKSAHKVLMVDPQDKRTTWDSVRYSADVFFKSTSEGNAGNVWHLLLFFIAFVYLAINKQKKFHLPFLQFALTASATFLLFAFYLKWQPWHSRLHLPFFVLAAVPTGFYLSQIAQKWRIVVFALLIVQALPYLIENPDRPVLNLLKNKNSRQNNYFNQISWNKENYLSAASVIKQQSCSRIGLLFGRDDPEYLFWVLLNKNKSHLRMEHIDLPNTDNKLKIANTSFDPCLIISTQINLPSIRYKDRNFINIWASPDWLIDRPVVYKQDFGIEY